ncbi:MAG: hypothetical protein F6J93_18655 [Oscillatoria sp. SIO1A7]|nr:hypothetical protein [Oscillatoria sp. SIO1A7]
MPVKSQKSKVKVPVDSGGLFLPRCTKVTRKKRSRICKYRTGGTPVLREI